MLCVIQDTRPRQGKEMETEDKASDDSTATYATTFALDTGLDNNNMEKKEKNGKRAMNALSDILEGEDDSDDSNQYESVLPAKNDKNETNGKKKITRMSSDKFKKSGSFDSTGSGSFDADDDLPPTPPEEWETSADRLGGKLYVAVKNFKARYPFEINVKLGEKVELTEIDPEDKSWHVRVTLATSLNGYTYTKRVGWVPYDVFTEYEGPDNRRDTRALSDVDHSQCIIEDVCRDEPRMSRSQSDVSGATQALSELNMTSRSATVGASNLNRRTGSWLGGTEVHLHLGHQFKANSLHVPVKCSYCQKWCSFQNQDTCEYQCITCKLVVHKGCHKRLLTRCRVDSTDAEAYCPIDEEKERFKRDLPHRFLVHTWKVPSRCTHCSGLIIGMVRQGLKCAECGANCHHKCKPNVANTCSTKYKEIADQLFEVEKARLWEKKKSSIRVITNQVIS